MVVRIRRALREADVRDLSKVDLVPLIADALYLPVSALSVRVFTQQEVSKQLLPADQAGSASWSISLGIKEPTGQGSYALYLGDPFKPLHNIYPTI